MSEPVTTPETNSREKRMKYPVVWLTVALAIAALLSAFLSRPGGIDATNAAVVLAVIGACAVGIERVLELLWTTIGDSKLGSWWPFSAINTQVEDLEATHLPEVLDWFWDHAKKIAADNGGADGLTEAKITEAANRLNEQLIELKKLAPGGQRANLLVGAAIGKVNWVTAQYGQLKDLVDPTLQGLNAVSDFVATVKENPKRRIASIYVGMLMGLVIASFLSLDLFVAVQYDPTPARDENADAARLSNGFLLIQEGQAGVEIPAACATVSVGTVSAIGNALRCEWETAQWGIVFTGLILGLGASPTHEVIKYLQEVKKAKKASNQPQVSTSAAPATISFAPAMIPAIEFEAAPGMTPSGQPSPAQTQAATAGRMPASNGVIRSFR